MSVIGDFSSLGIYFYKIVESNPSHKLSFTLNDFPSSKSRSIVVKQFLTKIENVPVISNIYFLYFLLWLIGYLLFLEFGFGIVYLTSSIIGVIFCNLGKREKGTLSAYSVFNPNFERLDGTFTSDDFERNVLHRQKAD